MAYDGDKGEGEDEGEDGEDGPVLRSASKLAAKSNPDNLYADANLMEEVDAIEGIENKEYARLKPFKGTEMCDDREIAIVGFWHLTSKQVFRCYHFFMVPSPMKREIKDTEGTVLKQVLFTGNRPSIDNELGDKPGDVFFFYERQPEAEELPKVLMHAILDWNRLEFTSSRRVENNCEVREIA